MNAEQLAAHRDSFERRFYAEFDFEPARLGLGYVEQIAQSAWQAYQWAIADAAAQENEDLVFVERWAVHHAGKPGITAEQALGCIAHYPGISAITKSYKDGKRPETFDPYAEIARLKAELAAQQSAQPVLRVDSWANGSYSRNYKVTWLSDVPEGALLYAAAQPVEVQPVKTKRIWARVKDGMSEPIEIKMPVGQKYTLINVSDPAGGQYVLLETDAPVEVPREPEPRYTVAEVESLRSACELLWLHGSTKPRDGISRSHTDAEKSVGVEELVRTCMAAGHRASDLYKADGIKPTGTEGAAC